MMSLKAVDKKHCNPPSKKFYQSRQNCKLAECPVDGGWGCWAEWGMCNHNCVNHPSADNKVATKAHRVRRRYCNKPLPYGKGKKCKKDKKYRWVSHLKAEEERSECCTENNKDGCDGDVTPWCPENCVHSKWSEWSHCSETCIVQNKPLNFAGGYKEGGNIQQQQASNIHIQPPCEPNTLPTQERFKVILKKERFNGNCDIMMMARNKTGKDKMLVSITQLSSTLLYFVSVPGKKVLYLQGALPQTGGEGR
jgi:hypothetical protein